MLDVVIRGGTVVDGTGAPGRPADVGIRGDRIVAVGEVTEEARHEIDATGKHVMPGWTDIHTCAPALGSEPRRYRPPAAAAPAAVATAAAATADQTTSIRYRPAGLSSRVRFIADS